MEWIAYLAASLFLVLGAVCVLSLLVQAPGTWMLLGLALLLEWLDRFYLPAGDRETFSPWVLGACLALALLGEGIELLGGVVGARRGGATRRGTWGALLGGVIGVFVLTPLFFFVPVLGALLGSALGTFVGAVVGELTDPAVPPAERGLRRVWRPATWAAIGRIVGTTGKVAVGVTMWLTLSVSAFWP